MSRKAYLLALPLIGFTAWIATGALATTHDFFKGKTMRIAVGASAGGRLTLRSNCRPSLAGYGRSAFVNFILPLLT
jgi:hypothetical protein